MSTFSGLLSTKKLKLTLKSHKQVAFITFVVVVVQFLCNIAVTGGCCYQGELVVSLHCSVHEVHSAQKHVFVLQLGNSSLLFIMAPIQWVPQIIILTRHLKGCMLYNNYSFLNIKNGIDIPTYYFPSVVGNCH